MDSPERLLLYDKLDDLRVAAKDAHPNSTRGIVDALCVVAELLARVIACLENDREPPPSKLTRRSR